jgi:hypothetical protein
VIKCVSATPPPIGYNAGMRVLALSLLTLIIAEVAIIVASARIPVDVYDNGEWGITLELRDDNGPYLLCSRSPTADEVMDRVSRYSPYPIAAVICLTVIGSCIHLRRKPQAAV